MVGILGGSPVVPAVCGGGSGLSWLGRSPVIPTLRARCSGLPGLGAPILPVTRRLGLIGDGDGHDVAPDISIGDGLAGVAVAWGIPVSAVGWGFSNGDGYRCWARWCCWDGGGSCDCWCGSGMWDGGDDGVA
jgi:hypothetical protein